MNNKDNKKDELKDVYTSLEEMSKRLKEVPVKPIKTKPKYAN